MNQSWYYMGIFEVTLRVNRQNMHAVERTDVSQVVIGPKRGGPRWILVSSRGYVTSFGKMQVDRHEITLDTPISCAQRSTLSLISVLSRRKESCKREKEKKLLFGSVGDKEALIYLVSHITI